MFDVSLDIVHAEFTVFSHLLLSILNTTILLGKFYQNSDFISIDSTCLDFLSERLHCLKIGIIQRIDNWQRQLTFCHIVSCRLTYLLGIEIIEDIIANLEHHTQIHTKLLSFSYCVIRSVSRQSTNGSTRLKQGSCLLLDNFVVDIFSDFLILDIRQLEQLTRS